MPPTQLHRSNSHTKQPFYLVTLGSKRKLLHLIGDAHKKMASFRPRPASNFEVRPRPPKGEGGGVGGVPQQVGGRAKEVKKEP